MKKYFVYIMTNYSKTLYTGVTNNLARRVEEHKNHPANTFTNRYRIKQLAYYEEYDNPQDAIAREKQIKGWVRAKKIKLIENLNPEWSDLSDELLEY